MNGSFRVQDGTGLVDATFIIPFRMDSPERRRNLHHVVSHVLQHFRTNIIVVEHDRASKECAFWQRDWPPSVRHLFLRAEGWHFERARCLNAGALLAQTPILVIQDADAYVPAHQYLHAAKLIRGGTCKLAFPYENRLMWIPEDLVPTFQNGGPKALESHDIPVSDDSYTIVSLSVFARRRDFVAAGMMNEHFKSWGYEDVEFYERVRTLGYAFQNVSGLVYHLDHPREENWGETPFFDHNRREYERVCGMTEEELRAYIRTWPWLKHPTSAPLHVDPVPGSAERVVGHA